MALWINHSLRIILLLSTILVLIWFKDGNIMATGESGIPFYNLNLQYEINRYAWASYALGHPTNISVVAAPTYFFLSLIQKIGIPPFLIQASFFWLVLVGSGLGIFFLTKELSPDTKEKYLILAVLFYWFNPISLVNIWNRFLNNFLFFYMLLPILVFLLLKSLKEKQYKYAIAIGLTSAAFSYAFTSIAFVLLFWGIIIYFLIFYFISDSTKRFFIINFFFILSVFWLLTNSWWISQVFSYFQAGSFNFVANTSFTPENNYLTFSLLSQRLGKLIYIFRLEHASFFSNANDLKWVGIYNFPLLIFMNFLMISVCLYSIILKRKNIFVLMLGVLFIGGIFFAKGSNAPLGEIFDQVFLRVPFIQIFRNPLEKMGFVLPLASAPLFSIGSFELSKFLSTRFRKIFYFVICFWLLLIWGFPFWTRLVFTSTEIPTNNLDINYETKVPKYYQEAQHWLNSRGKNFRLMLLPIGGEGITYNWEKGYTGVELTNQLLPKTAVSFNTNIPFYNDISKNIEKIFMQRSDFYKILDALNVKYLVVRSDINWKQRQMRDPNFIIQRLEKLEKSGKLKKVKKFDKLIFWENLDWQDRTVYTSDYVTKSNKYLIEDLLNTENDSTTLTQDQNFPERFLKNEIVYPKYEFQLNQKILSSDFIFRDELILPAVRILPSSKLYPLILLKEWIELKRQIEKNSLIIKKVTFLGKRLMEVKKEIEIGDFNDAEKSLNLYIKQLNDVKDSITGKEVMKDRYDFEQEDLYNVFNKHLKLIHDLKLNLSIENQQKIEQVEKILKQVAISRGIFPQFDYLNEEDQKPKHIYRFLIQKNGEYELLFSKYSITNISNTFPDIAKIQIDNQTVFREPVLKGEFISFGLFNLTTGNHEIGTYIPLREKTIEFPEEILFKVDHGTEERTFYPQNFDPFSVYFLSFGYFIKKGNGIEVKIEQNIDLTAKNKINPRYSKFIGPDFYNFEKKEFSTKFVPSPSADSIKLSLKVAPWNNCTSIHKTNRVERCEDENFRRPYDNTTEIVINNIEFSKQNTQVPFLRLDVVNILDFQSPKISFKKINNSEFRVNVQNASSQFILILSELFDPAWVLLTPGGEKTNAAHFVANSYANGWIIDKKGNYELIVSYLPQDLLSKGKIVSILSLLAGLSILGWKKNEKN